MLQNKTLLTASNLNNAYVSKIDTNAQSMNSTLTLSGGALTLKNSIITDNANNSYMRIDPQGNNVIIYDGVNNQRLDVYSSSGTESTYLTTVNGTKSIGKLDVSSAIDHLEINTSSLKPISLGGATTIVNNANDLLFIQSNRGTSGNRANINLLTYSGAYSSNAQISAIDDGSYGAHLALSTMTGAYNNPLTERMRIASNGNIGIGTAIPAYTLDVNGTINIEGSNSLNFGTYGGGFNMQDTTWIRTTGGKSFYQNTGTMRTDGTFQVGNGGATLSITNGGNFNYNNGTLFASPSNVGVGTSSPRNKLDIQGGGVVIGANIQNSGGFVDGTLTVGNTTYSYSGNNSGEGWGSNGDTITLQAKDYSTIAFLQANTKVDYIRGGAGVIDIGYDGGWGRSNVNFTNGIWNNSGKVGIGTTSPLQQLDVNGNIRLGQYVYSPDSYIGFLTDSGGALPVKVGSLAITNSYASVTPPSNGLYVQGNVGINNPSPAYNLDVSGNINVTGIIYSFGNNQANFQVGNDSQLWDINVPNTMGIYGVENSAVGALKLGSTGPTLYGSGNFLGIGTTNPAYSLDIVGNIRIASGHNILSDYNNAYFLADHADGDISLSAVGRNLVLGIQNTSQVAINAPLYGSNNTTEILGTDGTLYYKGTNTDSVYLRQDGTSAMSGDLNVNSHKIIFSSAGSANVDHIWYDDNTSPYGDGGSYHLVADSTGNAIGNATLFMNSLAVGNRIDMQNHSIYNTSYLYGQYGTIAKSVDEWLRLNDDGSHTSGVYFGSSVVRTDGQFQVGSSGSKLLIDGNGNITTAGYITAPVGATSSKIATVGFGHGNEMWGTSGASGNGSLYINYRSYDETTNNFMNTIIANGKGTTLFTVNGSSNAITTKNTTLDDGTGNMTLSGILNVNGGTVQSPSNVDLWVKGQSLQARILNSSGSLFVSNSAGAMIFQAGTSSNAVYTKNNTLDDGSSGNLTIKGTATLGADPTSAMQSTTKQYVDRKTSFIPMNSWYAKNPIDDYPNAMFSAMKFNGSLSGQDWGSGSDGMSAGLVVTHASRDSALDNNSGVLYPGSVHQMLYHESGYGLYHRYANVSRAYSGISVWSPSIAPSLNSLYMPTQANENGYYYKVTTTGNASNTEPLWGTTVGGTTTDGTMVWTNQGTIWAGFDKILTGKTINATDVSTAVGQGLTTTSNPTFSGLNVNGNITGSATFISNSTSQDVFQALGASGTKTFRWEGGNLRFWSSQSGVGEALTLASNGNIGIHNTTSPAYQLDVSGDIRTTTAFRATTNNTEALYVGSNSAIWDINTANTIGIYGQQNTAIGNVKLGSTGPTLYGTGSNLGINTSSPLTPLHVYTNSDVWAFSIGDGSNSNLRFAGTASGDNGYGVIQQFSGGTAKGNLVLQRDAGYVGIRTSSPTYTLDVNGDINTSGVLRYQGQDIDSRYVNTTGDTMSSDLTFSNVNSGIGLTVVSSGSANKTSGNWITGGNDYAGLAKINDIAIQTWYGFSVSPTISGQPIAQGTPAFAVNARTGETWVAGNLYMQNKPLSGITTITGQYGRIANSRSDEWLGINDDVSHTSGVYFGSSIVRTDGTLQVGSSGQTLNIPQNGTLNWQSGNLTLTSGGALTAKGLISSVTTYGQGQGFKLDSVTIDTVISTGNVGIGGLNQLRFGTSTSFDWNQWAGIKYDSNSHYLYIGGPASQFFNSNSTPPTINVAFTGVGNVGIGKDAPTKTLDIAGDFKLDGDIYANSSWIGIYNGSGSATTVRTGGLSIGTNYSIAPPSDGLYVQGNTGLGTSSPWGMLHVAESGMDMYTSNDHLYLQSKGSNYPFIGFLDSGGTRGGYLGYGTPGSYINFILENNNDLYIDGGNVGIRTATPAYPLDVVGNIRSDSPYITTSNNDVFQALGTGNTVKTFRYDNSNLRFWTNSIEVMTLSSGGNVGINQANPSYTLDVNGTLNVTGVVYSPATNAKAYQVGSNSELWDINVANTMGLYGHSNTAVGALKLGSTGPTLYGSGGTLGIGTTAPWTSMALDVNGSIRVASGHGIYSGYNNNYIVNDHGNGNVTLNATSSASGNLYLGYNNTAHVYLSTNLTTTSNTNIIGTDGTLYYKGADTNSTYHRLDGTNTITGTVFINKTSTHLQLQESGNNKWHFESVNGLLKFVETGVSNRLTIAQGGATNLYGTFNMNNNPLSGVTTITGQYGTIAKSTDEWLRLNDDGSHTNGVYFGSSIVRTDGSLQVGGNGYLFNANSSGITLGAIPIINRSGNGTELLRFNTDNDWSFYQSGSGSSANLALKSSVANKDFIIENVSGNAVLDVFTGSGNVDGMVTVNGDLQVNSGTQGMSGYVHGAQAVPDFKNYTSISTSGWYNIAHNPNGDRASGTFILEDTSISKHSLVKFETAFAYGVGSTFSMFFTQNYRAGSKVVTALRVVYNGSSEYFLQAYVNLASGATATLRAVLDNNYWETGWQLLNWTAGTVPTGYSYDLYDITAFDRKPNVWSGTGSPPSTGAGVGDIYVQY